MDLWLAIAALLRPFGIDGVQLQTLTGINRFNVYDWLSRATEVGMLTQLTGWSGRRDRFIVPPTQIPILGEYIRNAWWDWRQGRTIARLRPVIRYFVASTEWPTFEKIGGDDVVPTGVTWLEGHGGDRLLTPEGTIPRLAFFCTTPIWDRLVAETRIAPRTKQERPYDSEAIILVEDHPFWLIGRQRHVDDFTPAWPAGLRALDAMQDPTPRIRDVAEAAWKNWLDQHRIHVENRQGDIS
jgi:hypothetical protein